MLSMNDNQAGGMNKLTIPLVLVLLLFVIAVIFGIWAFSGQQDYKKNTNQKIAVAVEAAQKKQSATDATNYSYEEQKPFLTYNGPSEYGSLSIMYPKDWSAYVIVAAANQQSSTPINGYFDPGVIPDVQNTASVFSLRFEIVQQSYSQVVQSYSANTTAKLVTVTPYALPKVPSDIGVMVNGEIAQNIQGSMVILPIRETTLEVWTETSAFMTDFNTVILPNISFSP